MKLRPTARRRQTKLRLELLEDRITPSSSVIESFESGSLAAYTTALRALPSAAILPIAAHDGGQGLVKQDGYEWLIRNDSGSQVQQGDTVSAWIQFADVADGRAYLGFDSKDIAPAHATLSAGGTMAVVLAANTNQLIIQKDSGSNGVASFTNLAAVSQTYQADHWYRVEATWGAGGAITGRLYDSDGTTLLGSASATTTVPFPSGAGIAFRGFGHDKYFDTVVVDSGSTDTPDQRVAVDPGLNDDWTPGDPPPPVGNGPSGGPAPVPWQYTGTPGTGIEVQLASFNQLQQVAIVNGVVGLAAANNSLITGTAQVGWGDPLETPLLAQYIFRQRPGEQTQLIGASSVKHFFSSAHADSQHLNPGENDTYGASLNATQSLYTYGSELDPVTGTLHTPIDRGTLSADGIVNNGSRTFSSPIELLLQVSVADLDPAQNPAGTKWYLMGNLFVGGEQDVTQASRWVQFTPHFNGTTFTFTYDAPGGSTGQLNFRTIPGLVEPAGPYVTMQDTGAGSFGPVNHVRVTFNTAIDTSTFTTDQIASFTRTVGSTATNLLSSITGITPVDGTAGRQFDITFTSQTQLGLYKLTFGPNVYDLSGNAMDQNQNGTAGEDADTYTATFSIQGPKIIGATPAAGSTNTLPSAKGTVRVTFNEPVDPTTFTPYEVLARGPHGTIAASAVTPVTGSNNTQFDVTLPLITTGSYTLLIGPDIQDPAGHKMDQNGNFIDGELPGDLYALQFGVQGLRVNASSLNSNLPGAAYSVHLTFNEQVALSSFTTAAVSLSGPDGAHTIIGVAPTNTNYTQFDVLFAPLTAAGTYTVTVSPSVYDVYGNKMDQNNNLVPGESGDAYTSNFTLIGPRVTAVSPTGTLTQPLDHLRVTFNEPIDPSSFTLGKITAFTRTANGATTDLLSALTSVTPVPFTNDTQFDITFDTQGANGSYTLALSPAVADAYGNLMGAPFSTQFTVTGGPRVTSFSPTGSVSGPVDHVRVTFDRAIDPATFTPDQVTFVMGGNPIAVTGVVEVDGSDHTQFDVTFDPQTEAGSYSLTLSTDITDLFGNHLLSGATGQLVTNGGFETGNFSGWTQSGDLSFTSVSSSLTHSGTYAARVGPSGPGLGFLTQTLATTAGVTYTLDFWLANPSGGSGTEWLVRVGGVTLADVTNSSAFGYTHYTFTFTATGSSTALQFGFVHPPDYFYLDDVSVTPVGGGLTDMFTIL
jgi:hypothetical protein